MRTDTFSKWALGALVLLTVLVFVLLGRSVHAADATLTWTHPTQRVDNTPITLADIRETQLDWGVCGVGNTFPATPAGTKAVPAPGTTTVVTGLAYGTWCFRARSVDTGGLVSDNTGTVWKQFIAPPKPPVLSATITVAYEINMNSWGEIKLGARVGTVEQGAPCVDNPIMTNKGEYFEIDRANVVLSKEPKSSIIVTQCSWQG
jgi:hypothetical protein